MSTSALFVFRRILFISYSKDQNKQKKSIFVKNEVNDLLLWTTINQIVIHIAITDQRQHSF